MCVLSPWGIYMYVYTSASVMRVVSSDTETRV